MARGEIDFRDIRVVVNGEHSELYICALKGLRFCAKLLFVTFECHAVQPRRSL